MFYSKKSFTLIELVSVIAIVAILASLVIPNVRNTKQNAIKAEVISNIQHLQTAVDMFCIDNNGKLPTFQKPTIGNPQLINFSLLYPKYIKNLPNPSINYWIDFTGKVWGSTIEAPYNLNSENGYLKWEKDEDATGYDIYVVENTASNLTSSINNRVSIKKIGSFKTKPDYKLIQHEINEENIYLISAIDKYNFPTAPTGGNYIPAFKPITIEGNNTERIFYISIRSSSKAEWLAYEALEYKPEGTDIIYEFATSNDGKNYTEFTSNFDALENSTILRVKITLKREVDKESPVVYNFKVIYKPEGYEDIQYSYVDLTDENMQDIINESQETSFQDTTIQKLTPIVKNTSQGINYSQDGKGNVYIHKDSSKGLIFREVDLGGLYLIDKITSPVIGNYGSSSNKVYYQTSVDGINWSEASAFPRYFPAGRYVRIINEIDGTQEVVLQPPIIQTTSPSNANKIKEQIVNTEFILPNIQENEWEQIDIFTITQDATEVVEWISINTDAIIPEDTRIVYKFYTSDDGVNWEQPMENIRDLKYSRYLKVDVISERKANSKSNNYPIISEVFVNYERINGDNNFDLSKYVKVLYVDSNNGNDKTGDGNINTPYKSLQEALNVAKNGDAIYLKQGQYFMTSFKSIFEKQGVDIIGEGQGTYLNIQNFYDSTLNPTNNFYKLIIRPDSSFPKKTSLVDLGLKSKTINLGFYNVVFEDPYNRLIKNQRHSSYIVADRSRFIYHTYKKFEFVNCVALDTPIVSVWSDYNDFRVRPQIKIINSATNVSNIDCPNNECGDKYAHDTLIVTTSFEKVTFDNKYNIIDREWRNKGTGLNPDGTQAHIGVYGGSGAWSIN